MQKNNKMRKKTNLLILLFLICNITAFANNSFTINSRDTIIFGKSFKNATSIGFLIYSPSNTEKKSWDNGYKTISWISKYRSITFNQYSKDLPVSGMNEMGLVVDIVPLVETSYSYKSNFLNINEFEFVKYSLDNFSSVEEVVEFAKKTNIVPLFDKVQYLIADKKGNSAVIEYIDGNTIILQKDKLPYNILTNNSYACSIEEINKDEKKRTEDSESFIKLINTIYSNKLVDLSYENIFNIIAGSSASKAKWEIIYDITALKVLFKTSESPAIKEIEFNKMKDNKSNKFIAVNSVAVGNIDNKLKNITSEDNIELMNNIFKILPTKGFFPDEIKMIGSSDESQITKALEARGKRVGSLKIIIHGLSNNKGKLNLSIFDSESSFDKQIAMSNEYYSIKNKIVVVEFYNLPLNKWYAFSYFQDQNMNKRIDRHWTGFPKESWGISGKGGNFKKSSFILDKKNQIESVKNKGFLFF